MGSSDDDSNLIWLFEINKAELVVDSNEGELVKEDMPILGRER